MTATRLLGLMASLAIIAASMSMNGMFLFSQGKTPVESWVFVVMSVAADVWKAILPIVIAEAWEAKRRGKTVAGAAMLAVLLLFSFGSALGYAAMNRGFLADARGFESTSLKDLERETARLDGVIARAERLRPVPVIERELATQRVERAWEETKGCTDIRAREVREFCRGYRQVEAELATAAEVARHVAERARVRERMSRLVASGAGQESDALAAYLSRLTGFGTAILRDVLIVAVALVVELGSAFGLFLAGFGRVMRSDPTPASAVGQQSEAARPMISAKPLSRRIGAGQPGASEQARKSLN